MGIKPANILIFNSEREVSHWKLADFGMTEFETAEKNSRGFSYRNSDFCYMPPETANNRNSIGQKVDVWAFGCIILEVIVWLHSGHTESWHLPRHGKLWHKNRPSNAANLKPSVINILSQLRQKQDEAILCADVLDLLENTLEVKHEQRITIADVEHRLASVLARLHATSTIGRPYNVFQEVGEVGADESDVTSFTSDSDKGGAETPESDFLPSELQEREIWQTRKMYPFILQGLEPKPVPETIAITLARIAYSKGGLRSLAGQANDSEQALKHAVLRSLSHSDSIVQKQQIAIAGNGTLEWVFEEPTFLRWLNQSDCTSLYWFEGKIGSGKSTLMNHIARSSRRISSAVTNGLSPTFVSHFFRFEGSISQRSLHGLMQSLLYQLLNQRNQLVRLLFDDMWEEAANYTVDFLKSLPKAWHEWSLPELSRTIFDFLELLDPEDRFLVLIDGLDECDGDGLRDVVAFMSQLSLIPNLKICFASRPHFLLTDAFDSVLRISIDQSTAHDAEVYTSNRIKAVNGSTTKPSESQISDLTSDLISRAEGFLPLVYLRVDRFTERMASGAHRSDLLRSLQTTMGDLRHVVHTGLQRIAAEHQIEAFMALQVVANSPVPLQFSTLKYAIALDDTNAWMNDPRHFVSICGDLLQIQPATSG